EDIGDDAVYASELGIKNLKRILPNLIEWSYEVGKDYSQLDEMYGALVGQFRRYIGHVGNNIGGVYEYYKTADQAEPVYSHVPKDHRAKAMGFINEYVLNTPDWLIDKDIMARVTDNEVLDPINSVQSYALRLLLRGDRIDRMVENEMLNGEDAYTVIDMFKSLENNIYSDVDAEEISIPRKNLHRMFISRLQSIVDDALESGRHDELSTQALASLHRLYNRFGEVGPDNAHGLALKSSIKKSLDL
ncbi:MAG: zinc-dependent metalloprotease, partial [Saprospiraceae bacterium]